MRATPFVPFFALLAVVAMTLTVSPAGARDSEVNPRASTITLNTSPARLILEVNGTPTLAPYSFVCEPGTNRTINAPSPQEDAGTRYSFANWSDGGSRSHVIDCSTSANLTAHFTIEYGLTLDTSPRGLILDVEGAPAQTPTVFWCSPGSLLTVSAPSPQGFNATQFVFTNWSDGGGQVRTVSCDSPRSLVAFFRMTTTIAIFSIRQGDFVVQVDGILHTLPHAFRCDFGSEHVLTVPTPQTVSGAVWRFSGWFDIGPTPDPRPRTILCDGPRNYTAMFERVDETGPAQPPTGPTILLAVLALVGVVIGVPILVLFWVDRKRPRRAGPPPVPLGVGRPSAAMKACPRCGSRNESDWAYCMDCGESIR